ncbi:pleiotropic drug resistance ABC transporter [Gloeophyllum trabeum ATCC 11539]|uniref:Pleiotropic drug resistance ABC transporter n=1 Tax=Gloeophyllum trabeum (strain ATCC 11539 / FP-39264 / Madison 617) TaxID=670483 RepID=S7PSI6_GLOTA|nr:pleiotropic drug resistance ABC transporter [Gloeophyllum trabeum ATCC 11539]EPQ50781.1 pleiotropic drug resistance ABC transporter [Gloeophyllum trabeum ATCC 11539]
MASPEPQGRSTPAEETESRDQFPTFATVESPQPEHKTPGRRGSTYSHASHVSLDHFDHEGVEALRRTLSRQSQAAAANKEMAESLHASEATVAGTDEPFDFEKVLRRTVQKLAESDIKKRELGVVFQNLKVVGMGSTASYQQTLGSLLNPTTMVESIRKLRHPPLRDILAGFEGVVRPGEMLLVLGRPGSGCSTLLKTLANQRDEYYAVQGDVMYDAFSPQDVAKHYRGDVQYCPEDDIHFPTLTVEQTISFAAKVRTPRARVDGISREQYVAHVVDVLTTIFGLRHVRKTLVGDASIRGVSGGEKKRVSIAEALATNSLLNSWDNSTRGLDSSTALEFVRALRIATDVYRQSTVVSIYQAGESLYELFDKVCVIYEGKMAYFGPADRARQYFIDMGYEPANRQTTADFLVAVTDPNGRIPRDMPHPIPRTATEFAEHFRKSELAALNRDDIEAYKAEVQSQPQRALEYRQSAKAAHAKHTNPKSPYLISVPMQTRALITRRVQILRGNMAGQVVNLVSFIIQGIIMGTTFLRVPNNTSAYFSRGGILFFALLFSGLQSMAEIPALFAQRPIVLRQYKAAMYHPFVEALAMTLVDIPVTVTTLIVFAIIIYFLVGLQLSAAQFFVFFLFIFTMTLTLKAWFRALAASFKDPAPAQTIAGVVLLGLVLYTGYNIPKPSMIGALRWITYINPLRYGYEAILTNEFRTLNGTCATLVPSGPGYDTVSLANQVCTTVGSAPGQPYVDGNRYVELSYGYSYSNTWRNYGIVVAFGIAFLAALLLVTEFNTAAGAETAVMLYKRGTKAPVHEEEENGKGDPEKGGATATADSTRPGSLAETEKVIAQAAPKMQDVFTWQHLQYVVPVGGGDHRKLLDDVSGYVAPGKLTALMGESGAGKTTLLNVLAQRTSTGVVTGDRFVNGQALPADFQAQTGYCQQMDTHLETTSVREALLFSAKLRQPQSVPLSEKKAYVETCLKMCGLEDHADAIVGTLGVEHRKRTTIGVELAAKPKLLLFLDEPTSGLDSQSAWAIMQFLRSLADNGQAILCTIHQPSAELFQVFDKLLLLRKGGQTVYFGDLGRHATTMIHYFEKNGSRKCAPNENPAEFMLDVIGAGATATTDRDWHDIWMRSEENQRTTKEIEEIHEEGRRRPPVEATVHTEFTTSWLYQVQELTRRDLSAHWRDPVYLMAKIMLNILSGLFIGFTFFKSKDTIQGTQNKLFAIFMGTINSVPLASQLQVPFIRTRTIYEIRERPSRMYSWTALVTAMIIVEIPWNIFGSSLFFLCWYWTVGFPTSRAGYTYLVYAVVFPLYYTTIGQAVAAMSATAEIAAILFSFLFSFVLTFNGVMQPFRLLGWWQWMYRVTPFTYLIEGLLGQAVGRSQVRCSAVEYVQVNPPSGSTCGQYLQNYIANAGGYLTNPDATSQCNYCSINSTDAFLEGNFNILYSRHWRDLGLLFVYIAFNITCVYVFMYLFRIPKKGSLGGWLKKRFARRA